MRHRIAGDKLHVEHSMLPGLREILETMAGWPEVTFVRAGPIKHTGSRGPRTLKVSAVLEHEVRLAYRSSGAIQVVWVTTPGPGTVAARVKGKSP